jgi:hypothetical protein
MPVNNWDVLKEMGERNSSKIEMAPLDNIIRVTYYESRGTEVTIGVSGNRCFAFERGDYFGGLLLADRKEFDEVKADLDQGIEVPSWMLIGRRLLVVSKLPSAQRCYCCWWAKADCPHCPKNKSGAERLLEDPKGAVPMQDCECDAFARRIGGMPPKVPEITGQMILDAGLNLWGLQLFAESVAGKNDSKTFSPFVFLHRGIKVTLEPSGEVDTRHR